VSFRRVKAPTGVRAQPHPQRAQVWAWKSSAHRVRTRGVLVASGS
jgi:hypothetical protein